MSKIYPTVDSSQQSHIIWLAGLLEEVGIQGLGKQGGAYYQKSGYESPVGDAFQQVQEASNGSINTWSYLSQHRST